MFFAGYLRLAMIISYTEPLENTPTERGSPTSEPPIRLRKKKLDDGWPESEKDVFQAALRMVVVKDSR